MSLFVKIPKNEQALIRSGSYAKYLDVIDGASTHVQRRMGKGGLAGYETQTMSTILALSETCQGNGVFYDVGAHVGLYSALVSTLFNDMNVYAFEPTPDVARTAMSIRYRNQLGYSISTFAVSSQSGSTSFYLSTRAETSNSLNSAFRPGAKSINVSVDTIDNFVQNGAPPPSFMKIDVETHEPDVILGSIGVIKNYKPIIICEFLREVNEGKLRDALSLLDDIGYSFRQISATTHWPAQSISEVIRKRTARETSRDWLICPGEPPQGFYEAFQIWMSDIAQCNQTDNVSVDDGDIIPDEVLSFWSVQNKGRILTPFSRGPLPSTRPIENEAFPPLANAPRFDSSSYWEDRYAAGLDSGAGSYGRLADFKAEVLNRFVAENSVASVIEFGSGDGNQVALAQYPSYTGVDVSKTIVENCRERFSKDKTKEFITLDEYAGQKADLSLSLDVIYHLVDDEVFYTYMKNVFGAANRYVIVYSSNFDGSRRHKHIRHRKFVPWVESNYPSFSLVRKVDNAYGFHMKKEGDSPKEFSPADFYIFEKKS